jgi:hypothetical protein
MELEDTTQQLADYRAQQEVPVVVEMLIRALVALVIHLALHPFKVTLVAQAAV